ncbi:hypothetical protein ZWY2020_024479 [Hordeum vulgare]|nr:hypothetical protein ZWY2020_024479 [Hordeum vulgare]
MKEGDVAAGGVVRIQDLLPLGPCARPAAPGRSRLAAPAAARGMPSLQLLQLTERGRGLLASRRCARAVLQSLVLSNRYQWEKMQRQRQEAAVKAAASQSASGGETWTPESDVDNDAFPELDTLPTALQGIGTTNAAMLPKEEVQELELDTDEWLMGISLDDLQGPGSLMLPWDDSYAASFLSPVAAMKMEQNISLFLF